MRAARASRDRCERGARAAPPSGPGDDEGGFCSAGRFGEAAERELQTIAYPLQHISAPKAGDFELFLALKSLVQSTPLDTDVVEYDSQSNAFLIRASAPMIAEMVAVIKELDRPK